MNKNKNKNKIGFMAGSIIILAVFGYLFSTRVLGQDTTLINPTSIEPILKTDHYNTTVNTTTTAPFPETSAIIKDDPTITAPEEIATETTTTVVAPIEVIRDIPINNTDTATTSVTNTIPEKTIEAPENITITPEINIPSSSPATTETSELLNTKTSNINDQPKIDKPLINEKNSYPIQQTEKALIGERKSVIENNYEMQQINLRERFGEMTPDLDFDKDGLSNEDERRFGTDPYLADSDKDGYIDGDEIGNGFNPMQFSPGDKSDKIIFQTPREGGEINAEYKIKNVTIKKIEDKNKAVFSGSGPANTFVTIFIYSENPIIVVIRTDSRGEWTYELDKELEDGDHEVYVAVNDNTGKISAKSDSFPFIKTAQAITEKPINIPDTASPIKKGGFNNLVYVLIIVVAVFSIALVLIKAVMVYKK